MTVDHSNTGRERSARPVPFAIACLLAVALATCLSGCNREQSDWEAAGRADSLESYQGFLEAHPSGKHFAEAKARVSALEEERAWEDATKLKTRESMRAYQSTYPTGAHIEKCEDLLRGIAKSEWGALGDQSTDAERQTVLKSYSAQELPPDARKWQEWFAADQAVRAALKEKLPHLRDPRVDLRGGAGQYVCTIRFRAPLSNPTRSGVKRNDALRLDGIVRAALGQPESLRLLVRSYVDFSEDSGVDSVTLDGRVVRHGMTRKDLMTLLDKSTRTPEQDWGWTADLPEYLMVTGMTSRQELFLYFKEGKLIAIGGEKAMLEEVRTKSD